MIKLTDFVHRYDNIIKKEVCEEIINQKDLKFNLATVSGGKVNKHRNCLVKPIEKKFDNKIQKIISKIIQLYMEDHKHFGPGMNSIEEFSFEKNCSHVILSRKSKATRTFHNFFELDFFEVISLLRKSYKIVYFKNLSCALFSLSTIVVF